MKIQNIRQEKSDSRSRVSATVIWEDCERPEEEVFFETDEAFADSLSGSPHAFLIVCAIPASHYREKRVYIDAEICSELRQGLTVALAWLRYWFGTHHEPISIESSKSGIAAGATEPRAACFLSGGVDSLALLRANQVNFPNDHPLSIKDALVVYGL
jgi:hypothetical protein